MSILQAATRFLQHQDVFTKQLVSIAPEAAGCVRIQTKAGEWVITTTYPLPLEKKEEQKIERIYVALLSTQVDAAVACAQQAHADKRVRVLIFNKAGEKKTHFVPATIPENTISSYVKALFNHIE